MNPLIHFIYIYIYIYIYCIYITKYVFILDVMFTYWVNPVNYPEVGKLYCALLGLVVQYEVCVYITCIYICILYLG